jgi:transcriptional regulator with XRE-family HTH domain
MKQEICTVSANLKSLREARNLSLDQLAELTKVSKSMLRQIESGKSSPTIATIWKIANGLRVSFSTLLKNPPVEARVKPYKEEAPLTGENGAYRIYPLIPFNPEQAMETYYVEMDAGTTFHGEPHEGNVHEYIFVKCGTIQVTVQGKSFVAGEDEFLQFHANHPHEYRNIGEGQAAMLMQISYLG